MANSLVVPISETNTAPPEGATNAVTPAFNTPAPQASNMASQPPVDYADDAVKQVINGTVPTPKPTMQASIASVVGVDAEYEAEARRIAARTGVPVQTVYSEPKAMKQKAALADIDFATYEQLFPESAKVLSDIELAKIAHDDTENMGYTENILRGIGQSAVNLQGGLFRGVGTVAQNVSRKVDDRVPSVLELYPNFGLRHMTPAERASATGMDDTVKSLEKFGLGYTQRTTWEDVKQRPLSQFLPFAIEQGLLSAPHMAAAVFNPAGYFTALTGQIGQNRAQNDQRQEATVDDFMKAAPAAAASALLERFATRGIIGVDDAIKGFKEIPKAAGEAALKEGSTEAAQNALQYASETAGTKKGFSNVEFFDQALQGAVAGGPFGAAVRGVTGSAQAISAGDLRTDKIAAGMKAAVEKSRQGIMTAVKAEQNAQRFEKLNTLAAESKLRTRDPLAFQNFIERVVEGDDAVENVYIDPKALAQSGISVEELGKASPSIAAQYREALEIGSDMKIPVSEYATNLAGTELGEAMVDHMKVTPLGMSREEARVFMESNQVEQLRTDVERVISEQRQNSMEKDATDIVKQNVLEQLNTANRFSKDANEQYSVLYSNFYRTMASRLNTTPEQLYQQHPIRIESTINADLAERQGYVDTLTEAYNNNELPTEATAEGWSKIFSGSPEQQKAFRNSGLRHWLISQKKPVSKEDVQRFLLTNSMKRNLQQGAEDKPRGNFNRAENLITLFKQADLSTFLHETGHFFLETMNKLALDTNGPPAIKKDMQTVFDWLGVKDIQEWNSHDLEWQREKHEQFARGFEAYLFEGKAPNMEMRGIFRRFKDWLKSVYYHVSSLDVELNEDIRQVFERMLATDDQIKEMQLARGFEPLFADAATAGMTAEQWQEYQELGLQSTQEASDQLAQRSLRDMKWLSNAKSRVLKDLQREAAGRRREVRDQVTEEVMAQPINQAREFITKGKILAPEGLPDFIQKEMAQMGSTKLSLDALKEMYGEKEDAIWRSLTKGKYGEVSEQGVAPKMVAEMFGFSSADELVKTLVNTPKIKDQINNLTDQRMMEKYGDLNSPEAINRAADEAIHNEARARFVATELNALQTAIGGRKILADAARDFAQNMISRLKIRELSPARYSIAEARAARAAEKAIRQGKLAEAAVEKRNQLIQNYASKTSSEAVREVEKALRYFKKFERDGTRKNIDTEYLEQIDALLDRFDLRKSISLKQIDRRKSLMEWKNAQEDMGLEPEIPEELLNEASRKHYKDMTVEEIRGLRDTIKQIDHLGKLKNRLLTAKDKRDFKTTVTGLVESINGNSGGRVVDNRTRASNKDQAIRLFKGFVASHRKIASLTRELDGFKDGGPLWETLLRGMNEAGDKEATMRAKATQDVAKLLKPLFAEGKMTGKDEFFPSINKKLNREERIGIALNVGNKGNLQRLLDGEGWTTEQLQPVLDSLTKADWDFVQNIWNFFESFRPDIGAKEKRIYGKEPEWVEPSAVSTRFGQYAGGYYPVKYDPRRSIAAEQYSDAEAAKQQMKGAFTSATTRRSFTKTRADEVKNRPLVYSMDGLYTGINEVIHDLAWHEWLIDANRLFRNKSLDGAIRNGYGADVVKQFKSAIQDIAGGEMPTGTSFEKGLADLRGGAVIAGLGFNIVNSMINLTGLTNSVVRVGPKWVAIGVAKWTQNPMGLTREVQEKSSFMRLRSQTMMRELNELQSLVRGKSRARAIMDRIMFAPMTITQIAVDTPTWYGAYQKALTEGNDESRSIALADQAVIDAQGGGQIKDLSAIQRGGPVMKLFTTFYGYFNSAYNLGAEATKATNFRDPMSVVKLGGTYLMLYSVPALMGRVISNVLTGGEDDWEPEKLAKNLASDQISYLMGLMVGARELTGAVQTLAGVNSYTSSYGGPAGLRFFQEFFKLASQIQQGEADEALIKSIINVIGIVKHLPASQINRTWTGVKALLEGETENPAAIFAGPPRN